MASVNKVILVGNLGKDPELRYTQSGIAFCSISLATAEHWTDNSGQRQEKTEWHRITVWKKQAENCAKYLRKGSSAYVEGRLQTRSWDDHGQKRYSTDIVAESVKFLGQAQAKDGRSNQQSNFVPPPASDPYENYSPPASLDDVPF
ncbi:MAG TPA: single-stranded DNA-binding protein [Oligoflexus sp.]|uniref:single-stranded DNA-binding protein n=1 Tax=Oligoflexus sp. TaxID=1971216 RepID=UPI002D4FFF76|nr:single-stranded DNA-binding protein [Oligoflexus sp.]HYX32608.1 single-stranded DNA-binding protein [Oligoflexus sp.]